MINIATFGQQRRYAGLSGYWYLASPYSRYSGGHDAAAEVAADAAALLFDHGIITYAAIVYGHAISRKVAARADDYRQWQLQNYAFLENAVGMIALEASGWEESEGMKDEFRWCANRNKPVIRMCPGQVPGELLAPS